MNKILIIVFLIVFNLDASSIFPFKVEYEGNEEEKKLLMSIVEPSAKTLIEKSKNGMVLIEKLKELFSLSGILTEARVLICFGDETKFSPSDLTGSPPKARLTEESLKQQELLMGEKDGVILEKLRVLTENKEHVEESYKSLFGEESIGGKKAKFLYNKVYSFRFASTY